MMKSTKGDEIPSAPQKRVIGSISITSMAETILVVEQLIGSKDCKLPVKVKMLGTVRNT